MAVIGTAVSPNIEYTHSILIDQNVYLLDRASVISCSMSLRQNINLPLNVCGS